MEIQYRLKEKSLLDGYNRQALADKAGIEKSTLYNLIRGTTRRETAEKVFDDVTENRGLSGASTNKIKLNLSAILTVAVKKEIMRRKRQAANAGLSCRNIFLICSKNTGAGRRWNASRLGTHGKSQTLFSQIRSATM